MRFSLIILLSTLAFAACGGMAGMETAVPTLTGPALIFFYTEA